MAHRMQNEKNILVIDDDRFLQQRMKLFLEHSYKCSVTLASEGRTACNYLKSHHQDTNLIISDVLMPECDGLEVIRFLYEREIKTPMLLLTSASKIVANSARTLSIAYDLNFVGLLRKPAKKGQLMDAIDGAQQILQ